MKKTNTKHKCAACKKTFHFNCLLKYHIRREHFNLTGFRPYHETQNINQIWFERVSNTNFLAKITKIGNNEIVIQKLSEETTIKETEMVREKIDLGLLYPTNRIKPLKCKICSETYPTKQMKNHVTESHGMVLKKNCDRCKKKFRSPLGVVNHVCPESTVE